MPLFNHEDWVATFQNLYHLARQIRSVSFFCHYKKYYLHKRRYDLTDWYQFILVVHLNPLEYLSNLSVCCCVWNIIAFLLLCVAWL